MRILEIARIPLIALVLTGISCVLSLSAWNFFGSHTFVLAFSVALTYGTLASILAWLVDILCWAVLNTFFKTPQDH